MNSISLQEIKFSPIERKIDHIVYSVSDLELAVDDFEQKLGIRPIFGGYHKTFGTKNALVNLGDGVYLELLAADDANQSIKTPRWMGIDVLTKSQITRWSLKSRALGSDSSILKAYNLDMGEVRKGSRTLANGTILRWMLSMPLSGPEVELVPFLLDWSKTEKHPSEILPDMGCALIELYATHPEPDAFTDVFTSLVYPIQIRQSNVISIKAVISTPKGTLEI